jgi:protein-disulfide isomerase
VLPELRRHYVDTGKLRYVARDLPLPMHAQAFPAAVVARCAGEQGRFWEFREALSMARMRLGEETYAKLAGEFGLDAARLEACRRDGTQVAAVRADMAAAARQGIHSTPTFVIGRVVDGEIRGELVVGSKDYETFAAKIDALLAAPR